MTFNYQRYGSYIGSDEGVASKAGRFDMNASQLIGDMSPVFVSHFHSGVLAGGTSQSSYNTWSYSVTMPALTYGLGDRYVFFMTGTRDANGAIAQSRIPSLDGATAQFTIGGVATTASNWEFSAEGHSDYNSIILGAVQTDAVGTTTATMQIDYTISSGGSDYMTLIVVDGISSLSANTNQSATSSAITSVSVNVTAPGSTGISQLRLVGGASSNSSTSNPTYNIDATQTGAGIGPYTTSGQGENGTSERYGVFYDYDATGGAKTTSIGGTVSTAATASDGLGYAAAIINLS